MLLNMSHPPTLPSHSGPPRLYDAFSAPQGLSSRPELVTGGQQSLPRDPGSTLNNAQQLPSLRTLLEPELLDTKSSDTSTRAAGSVQHPYSNGSSHPDSSSPTLKRRHDFDGYPRGYPEHNVATHQTSYPHRPPFPAAGIDTAPTTASTPISAYGGSRYDIQHRESFAVISHHDFPGKGFRSASSSSDPAGLLANYSHPDDKEDPSRPLRRRLDVSTRAPIRQSRLIGQREIAGEGACYIYEDGTYCRAVIDGEPVNPSWGITKAGKPRKRLAQACLTCREKKIKCEPGYPKCHQCQKSQRVCRGGLNQAGMSNASGETSPSNSAPLLKNPSTEFSSPTTNIDKTKTPGDPRDTLKKGDFWSVGTPLRAQPPRPKTTTISRDMSVQSLDSDWSGSPTDQGFDDPRRGFYQDQIALQWEQDPFEADPSLTLHLLELYFIHAGRATYAMFPRGPFLSWVQTHRDKGQDSLMLLYSVLSMGSIFSSDPEKRAIGKRFAAIAAHAAEKRFGKFSLQLCQTRLMLALYFFARGKSQEAWDFCGTGLRAISALKLNTEDGVKELAEGGPYFDYGFDRWTFEECCRRTFWSGLLMDVSFEAMKPAASIDSDQQQRYNGFFGGTLFVISIEDAFVRLPCPENMYETSTACEAPFYDEHLMRGQTLPPSGLGDMAYLCLISALWGEVLTFTGRAARRPDSGYEQHYESFYNTMSERLESWHSMLPAHLRYTVQNLDHSISNGHVGTFVSIHALYHATIIRLNRHVRIRILPTDNLQRNIRQAVSHASMFLSIMHALAPGSRHQRLQPSVASGFLFSTPFPGYALVLSIDVLSVAGPFSTLPSLVEMISLSSTCIDELSGSWASARIQQRTISTRLKQLNDINFLEGQASSRSNSGAFWKTGESIETAFGADDALYKTEDHLLFDIIGRLTSQ